MKSYLFLLFFLIFNSPNLLAQGYLKSFENAIASEREGKPFAALHFYEVTLKGLTKISSYKTEAQKQAHKQLKEVCQTKINNILQTCEAEVLVMDEKALKEAVMKLRRQQAASAFKASALKSDLAALKQSYKDLHEKAKNSMAQMASFEALELENIKLKRSNEALRFMGNSSETLAELPVTEEKVVVDNSKELKALQLENERLKKLLAESREVKETSVDLSKQGKSFDLQGDKAAAVKAFELALKKDPTNTDAFYYLLKYYSNRNAWDELLAVVDAYGYYFPNDQQPAVMAGYSALKDKKYWRAVKHYASAIAKDEKNVAAYTGLANAIDSLEGGAWSLEIFKKIFKLNSKDGSVAYNIAVLSWRNGDLEAARQWYEKAQSLGMAEDKDFTALLLKK